MIKVEIECYYSEKWHPSYIVDYKKTYVDLDAEIRRLKNTHSNAGSFITFPMHYGWENSKKGYCRQRGPITIDAKKITTYKERRDLNDDPQNDA